MAKTIQVCGDCRKIVELDFLERLMNLDLPVVCEKCRRRRIKRNGNTRKNNTDEEG